MNETFGSNQNNTNSQAPQPTGWAPQPVTPVTPTPSAAPASTPAASSPFEASPIPNITGPSSAPPVQDIGPVMMESAKPKSSLWLFIILIILIVAGLVFLALRMGWFNIGNPFAKKPTPTPSVTTPIIVVNKNDATRKTDLINLKTALTKYFDAKQSYPVSTTFSKTSDPDTSLKVLVPDYISSLPVDPLSPNNWYGYKSVDGKSFALTAVLEDKSDQAGMMDGENFLYTITDSSSETLTTSDPVVDPTLQTNVPTEPNAALETPLPVITLSPSTDTSASSSSTTGSAGADASSDASAIITP